MHLFGWSRSKAWEAVLCKYMEKEGGTNITAFYGAGARRKLNHAAFVISALQSSKGHIIIYIEQEDVNFDGKPFVDS